MLNADRSNFTPMLAAHAPCHGAAPRPASSTIHSIKAAACHGAGPQPAPAPQAAGQAPAQARAPVPQQAPAPHAAGPTPASSRSPEAPAPAVCQHVRHVKHIHQPPRHAQQLQLVCQHVPRQPQQAPPPPATIFNSDGWRSPLTLPTWNNKSSSGHWPSPTVLINSSSNPSTPFAIDINITLPIVMRNTSCPPL